MPAGRRTLKTGFDALEPLGPPAFIHLLPGEFVPLPLQRVAEAPSGARLYKRTFRRLIKNADLAEAIGRTILADAGDAQNCFVSDAKYWTGS